MHGRILVLAVGLRVVPSLVAGQPTGDPTCLGGTELRHPGKKGQHDERARRDREHG
jgi:hypothetical protein